MDYESELLFPRERIGRDHNVRNMNDHGKVIKVVVDETQVCVVCQILDKDGMVTKELPVKQFGSRSTGAFWCPKVGDDVSITFYPNSETGDGCVDGTFYSTSNPPPTTNPDSRHLSTEDGMLFDYDETNSTLQLTTKGPMTLKLESLTIEVPKITIKGEISMEGNFTLDGIILNTHKHDEVEPGEGTTGGPVN